MGRSGSRMGFAGCSWARVCAHHVRSVRVSRDVGVIVPMLLMQRLRPTEVKWLAEAAAASVLSLVLLPPCSAMASSSSVGHPQPCCLLESCRRGSTFRLPFPPPVQPPRPGLQKGPKSWCHSKGGCGRLTQASKHNSARLWANGLHLGKERALSPREGVRPLGWVLRQMGLRGRGAFLPGQ